MSEDICSVGGCPLRAHARGWCGAHYGRWRRYGDPLAPLVRTSNLGLSCSVEGCGKPRRKREWCGVHYAIWYTTGEVRPVKRSWATERKCIECGSTNVEPGRRRHCSARCAARWYSRNSTKRPPSTRRPSTRPASKPCTFCGSLIDLTVVGKRGHIKRQDTKLCLRCKQDKRKHGMSVVLLAKRDGTSCGICTESVDMALKRPNLMSPSVDHIIPRASGGTNDPNNLQLAHLLCNHIKSDRVDGLSARSGKRAA